MPSIVFRFAIGILLIIHGFAHWNIISLWGSRPAHTSWLAGALGLSQPTVRALGTALWVAAVVVFIAAGVGIFFHQGWWRALTVAGSAISLMVIVLFWSPNMAIGAVVDAAVLAALLWVQWPGPEIAGV